MGKKMIVLVLFVSLAFIISACASNSPSKGKIGDPVGTAVAAPGGANPVGTPLGPDNSKTPAAAGKIGDPVGTAVAAPGGANPVGTPLGPDNSKTPAAAGKIGDPVGTAVAAPGGANPVGTPVNTPK